MFVFALPSTAVYKQSKGRMAKDGAGLHAREPVLVDNAEKMEENSGQRGKGLLWGVG